MTKKSTYTRINRTGQPYDEPVIPASEFQKSRFRGVLQKGYKGAPVEIEVSASDPMEAEDMLRGECRTRGSTWRLAEVWELYRIEGINDDTGETQTGEFWALSQSGAHMKALREWGPPFRVWLRRDGPNG